MHKMFVHWKPGVLLVAGAAAGSAVIGSSSAASRSAGAAAAPTPPAIVTAHKITRQPGTVAVGTAVGAGHLGQRVFVNGNDGFALASRAEGQYPAASTDGGASWKTSGPALHVNAAQAPLSVTQVGAAGQRTYYYFGGGQVVDTTSDGGKHWWRAFLGDDVLAVVPGPGRLIAVAQVSLSNSTNKAATWIYVSKDGGKTWHYDSNLGGF
jgi:hypothetical protein